MRILLLTILFVSSFYYLSAGDKTKSPQIDSVKLKMGAPERAEERILTVEKVEKAPPAPSEASSSSEAAEESESETSSAQEDETVTEDLEHVQEVQWTELEEGWNNELKEMLGRLEPREGESMHTAYLSEQESYQAELDSLLNEKQQKSSYEAGREIDQLISQLEYKHQEKLKSILGAHYEAVRDHYEYFMEAPPEE